MGDTTDHLIELAQGAATAGATRARRREMDQLLATGEQVTSP